MDADAHLPPRKRLLAGLKRQSTDTNHPAPSTFHNVDTEYETPKPRNLNDPNLSNDEIVELSRAAAIEAAKVAEATRANAEFKASKAARAMASAKTALDLVATLSEEAANKEKNVRKSKMKKHITVEALYNQNKGNGNARTDEELARKLHQAINTSPRILKDQKHKRLKSSGSSIQTAVPLVEGATRDCMTKEMDMIVVDLNTAKMVESESTKTDESKFDKSTESFDNCVKKRGRMKQKKLPLSICNFRDQTNQRDELKHQDTQQHEDDDTNKNLSFQPDTPVKSLVTIEGTSTWKCQAFKIYTTCLCLLRIMQQWNHQNVCMNICGRKD